MHRPIATILYSTHFERAAQRIPAYLREEAGKREKLFRLNCFNPKLKTHKLKGKHADLWSFLLSYQYRIVFKFLSSDMVYFIDVGDHSIYQ